MVGYNFYEGMSNNAVHAYNTGKKPLSQITVRDLRLAGWQETKKLALALAKKNIWKACEWHHSGGTWYNRVNFYNPAELVDSWNRLDSKQKEEQRQSCSKKGKTQEAHRVEGSYTVWGGTRRRPRRIAEREFTGEKIGNWIYLDGGGKKKSDGNHIEWRFVQRDS